MIVSGVRLDHDRDRALRLGPSAPAAVTAGRRRAWARGRAGPGARSRAWPLAAAGLAGAAVAAGDAGGAGAQAAARTPVINTRLAARFAAHAPNG